MDSIRYLIDTNILIYHFADKIPEEEQLKINTILKNSFNISIITEIRNHSCLTPKSLFLI